MKSLHRSLLLTFAVVFGLTTLGYAQRNTRGSSDLRLKNHVVMVEYGRPALSGRTVQTLLSQLKPGQDWRLGADMSTTFVTAIDLNFNGTKVPKGVYSLWAQREAGNSWKLVFNSEWGQWGTSHDASKDVVSVPLKESKASSVAQKVTITLSNVGSGGEIAIQWGAMELSANFSPAS